MEFLIHAFPWRLAPAAEPWGWISLVSVVAAYYVAAGLVRTVPLEPYLPGLAIAVSALIGCLLQDRLTGPWDASYAVVTLLALFSVLVVSRMTWLRFSLIHGLSEQTKPFADPMRPEALTARMRWWVYLVVWILTLFALRFLNDASVRPWPTAIFLLVAAALAGSAGWIEMRGRSLWWSAILVNLALTSVWLIKARLWQTEPAAPLIDLFHVNALAAALPTLGWVLVFRHWKTRPDALGLPSRVSAVHRYLVPIAVLLMAVLATVWMHGRVAMGR